MPLDYLFERLVIVQVLDLLNRLNRINDIDLIEQLGVYVGQKLLFLIHVDFLELLNDTLPERFLNLATSYLGGCVVDVNDFLCLFILNYHAFLQIIEKLIVTDAQNLSFDVIHTDLDEAHAHKPDPGTYH